MRFLFSCWAIVMFVLQSIVLSPLIVLIRFLPENRRDVVMNKMVRFMSHLFLKSSFMFVKVYNRERIDFSKGYVVVANHSSYIDPPYLYLSIPSVFKSLGKFEIAKTPFFGLLYKSVVVLIDRSSAANRVKSFLQMNAELKKGHSIVIFPEGTFNEEEHILLPFQEGAFRLACMNGAPILPLIMLDARKRFEPGGLFRFNPGSNRCVYLPVFETAGLDTSQQQQLKTYFYEYMRACIVYAAQSDASTIYSFAEKWLIDHPL